MISFVGAGPGAPDLITLRGRDRLAAADVVVWASSLVPEAVLVHARPQAEIHDSAAMTLEDVLAVYAARPWRSRIVRLHSGDPSIYGAIGEQIAWCVEEGRDFEIVPGVSSLGAAAAALGRELTAPGVSQSVILTRLPGRTASSVRAGESVAALAAHGATMAVFLSGARPAELESELRAGGYGPDTPAAVVVRVSWPDQQVHETTVGELAATIASTGATRTVLVLVGDALRTPAPGSGVSPKGTGSGVSPKGTGSGVSPKSTGSGVSPKSTGSGVSPENTGSGVSPKGTGRSRLYAPDFAHAFRRRSAPGSTAGRPA